LGLTIHFSIEAQPKWPWKTVREKLEQLRQFARDLPVLEVSELREFRGKECLFDPRKPVETADEAMWRWAKIQGARSCETPYEPGTSWTQSPKCMLAFSIDVAPGCEPMNIGTADFSKSVRKPHYNPRRPDDERNYPASWYWCFPHKGRNRGTSHKESCKLIRGFLKKWKLRVLSRLPADHWDWCCDRIVYKIPYAMASIRKGRYQSHRKGYGPSWGMLSLDNQYPPDSRSLYFKYQGTAEEAKKAFSHPQFQKDLREIAWGAPWPIPAERGKWTSFTKTQYANDPRYGGWVNFKRAHLSVCAMLEKAQQVGFIVHVSDESDYWTNRDLGLLAKEIGEWDQLIAGGTFLFGEMVGAHGHQMETPMQGRPDLEHLEATGLAKLPMLEHLKRAVEELKHFERSREEDRTGVALD
jgi:hypothetical protein